MLLSINWDQLGQPRFDRVVESLVKRRYRGDDVRAVNGRGGDGGLDIEILPSSCRAPNWACCPQRGRDLLLADPFGRTCAAELFKVNTSQ
jgi:hypothetical protein